MPLTDRSLPQDLAPSRAIIDIGSNTVRLVVYGGPARAPVILHNEKVTARLGKGVAETGCLAPKAVELTLAALARYRAVLRLKGVAEGAVQVVATAAVRDAADGAAFLERAEALGLSPRLLSGPEEAISSAMGVIGAFPGAQGVVADLGGGSLELVDVAGGRCSPGVSLPIGTLRLGALLADGPRVFRKGLDARLAETGWSAPAPGGTLYLVGGAFRSLARFAQGPLEWPSDDPHGLELSARDAVKVAGSVSRRKADALAAVPGLAASRIASLPHAAALLLALLERIQPASVVFSSWGLREGLLFQALTPAEQGQDPLLAGVAAYARRYGAASATGAMVAGWTSAANGLSGAAGDEPLRLSAALLALALSLVEPNLRADTAFGWSMRKRWIGITTRQRSMLAACLMANAGRPDLPISGPGLASEADLAEARGWGLAIRLCRRLSAGSAEVLSGSALRVEDGNLLLVLQAGFAPLLNDAVQRDLRALAAHLGLRPDVAVLSEDAALS